MKNWKKETTEQRPQHCHSPGADDAPILLEGKAMWRVQVPHLLFGSSPGFSCNLTTSVESCGNTQHSLASLNCRDRIGRGLSYMQSSVPCSAPLLQTDGGSMKRDVRGGKPSLLRYIKLPLWSPVFLLRSWHVGSGLLNVEWFFRNIAFMVKKVT